MTRQPSRFRSIKEILDELKDAKPHSEGQSNLLTELMVSIGQLNDSIPSKPPESLIEELIDERFLPVPDGMDPEMLKAAALTAAMDGNKGCSVKAVVIEDETGSEIVKVTVVKKRPMSSQERMAAFTGAIDWGSFTDSTGKPYVKAKKETGT